MSATVDAKTPKYGMFGGLFCSTVTNMTMPRQNQLLLLLWSTGFFLGLSGWQPYDRATWLMEVFPVLLVAPLLMATYKRYPLTSLLYVLIAIHSLILMMGGAYTYAKVPLGFYLQDLWHLQRNPYDKIGHFAQGFVPALAAREILLRGDYVRGKRMLAFVVISIVLAISATYELIEWLAAVLMGQGADAFLGTQGDPWDTQSDMLFALIGGTVAVFTMSGWHDRQLKALAALNSKNPL